MKKIFIYCMQKDEDDILEQWIEYHSSIVNIENIYLIDNLSVNEKTKEILNKYNKKGLNVLTKDNYKNKGDYIYELIKENNRKFGIHIAIPLDLDEFIAFVSYKLEELTNEEKLLIKQCMKMNDIPKINNFLLKKEEEEEVEEEEEEEEVEEEEYLNFNSWILGYINPQKYIISDTIKIREYLESIFDKSDRYSFAYYFTSKNDKAYYENPIKDIKYFEICNLYDMNKKFFMSDKILFLDHGNHYGKTINDGSDYISNLILFHYHFRGTIKLIDKCVNDIVGLGYDIKNIQQLRSLCNSKTIGNHNIKTYIKFYDETINSLIDIIPKENKRKNIFEYEQSFIK